MCPVKIMSYVLWISGAWLTYSGVAETRVLHPELVDLLRGDASATRELLLISYGLASMAVGAVLRVLHRA